MTNLLKKLKQLVKPGEPFGTESLPMLDELRRKIILCDEAVNLTLSSEEFKVAREKSQLPSNEASVENYLSFSNLALFLINNQSDLTVVIHNYLSYANKRGASLIGSKSKNLFARQTAMICYEILQDSQFLTGKAIRQSVLTECSTPQGQTTIQLLADVVKERKRIAGLYENHFKEIRNSTMAHKGHNARVTWKEIEAIDELKIIQQGGEVFRFITLAMRFLNSLLEIMSQNFAAYNATLVTLLSAMRHSTAAPAANAGGEESPGNAGHPAS